MLAASGKVGYIKEPSHLNHRLGVCGVPFVRWYQYITDENEAEYRAALGRTVRFSYHYFAELKTLRSPTDIGRMFRDGGQFLYHQLRRSRPLVKDPMAFFAAPWMADRFDMDVVVLLRHPAAFASSLKRMDWQYPFSHFLEQPLLLRDYLQPFEAEIRAYAAAPPDIIDQANLLWRIIHQTASTFREQHPDWVFVRHEDLSRNPLTSFHALYDDLNLDFAPAIEETLRTFTGGHNPQEAPKDVIHQLKRDSKANIWSWKQRLTEAEIARVRANVAEVSAAFYGEEDW
jgi:hypothetical protein